MLEDRAQQSEHERTLARIVETAWDLAAEEGIAGISLRELARRVEMRQPSLYTYFPSKLGLYDEMFGRAYAELLGRMRDDEAPIEPVAWLRHSARFFLGWALERPARYQLLFQRTVPGFEPSQRAYAPAVEVEREFVAGLEARGFAGPTANPVWGLILVGLADQQIANDPGGTRWLDLVDEVAQMFATHHLSAQADRSRP